MRRTLAILGLVGWLVGPGWAQPDLNRLGQEAARLRSLSYRPVVSLVVSQAECAAYLRKLLDEELEPTRTRGREVFLKRLALMSEKADLKQILSQLYSEQVRGLYDPARKRYLVVKAAPGSQEDEVASMGAALGLDMTELLTVHELGHAIQDQHFNLSGLTRRLAGDFDRELAAQTLLEGDASVLMLDYAAVKLGIDPKVFASGGLGTDPGEMMTLGQTGALARAPRFFQQSLSFPYGQGMVFVQAVRGRGGWKAVDQAFARLPASSEQVMHPEKYLQGNDPPKPVSLAWLPGRVGSWAQLMEDTAGEFTVKIWAEESGGSMAAAAGWGGDRYRVYARGLESFAVWDTRWDTPKDAEEFETLVRQAFNKRFKSPKAGPEGTRWQTPTGWFRVRRQGARVTVWLGVPQELEGQLQWQ